MARVTAVYLQIGVSLSLLRALGVVRFRWAWEG